MWGGGLDRTRYDEEQGAELPECPECGAFMVEYGFGSGVYFACLECEKENQCKHEDCDAEAVRDGYCINCWDWLNGGL